MGGVKDRDLGLLRELRETFASFAVKST